VRLLIPAATKQGNATLAQGGYALIADRSPAENQGHPQPVRQFSASRPDGGYLVDSRPLRPIQSPYMPLVARRNFPFSTPIDTSRIPLTIRTGTQDAPNRGEKGMVGS
jgi:hypothetical protein